MAILNFNKIKLFLTAIFEFSRPQKNMKFMNGGHFEYPWKNHMHISISCECDCKIWIIYNFKFLRLQIFFWALAAIWKFCIIFQKSLALPHVAKNVMLKFQKKITSSFCAHKKTWHRTRAAGQNPGATLECRMTYLVSCWPSRVSDTWIYDQIWPTYTYH